VCTRVFARFLSEYYDNVDYFFFVVKLAAHADEGRVRAAKALLPLADDKERERYEKTISDPEATQHALKRFSRVNSRNLTNAAVNGFQRYFSEIIQSAILKRPELLRSNQTVRIEDVLQFKRHSELVSYLVDRKINELSYGGIREMENYLRDRLGVELFQNNVERAFLTAFIELRNVNVHNGGIINDLFLSRVGQVEGFTFKLGARYHVDFEEFALLADNSVRVALEIDKTISKKFRLRRMKFSAWPSG
jgi:hypothetical protein